MKKSIAVLISDVHYNLDTLELADKAMNIAINLANVLNVPLMVLGDLHDTKALLRGECVERMIRTISRCLIKPYILVGNHDLINEKSKNHSLTFLQSYAKVIDSPYQDPVTKICFLPYNHDSSEIKSALNGILPGSLVLMHQGIIGENMGEYSQDKSAIPKEWLAPYIVHSGHYHSRTDIYIGNPYTLTFGEAKDPEKGFKVLFDDGSAEISPTNLRKHIVYESTVSGLKTLNLTYSIHDLVWLKLSGTREEFNSEVRSNIPAEWKVDFTPTDSNKVVEVSDYVSNYELLDQIIENSSSSKEQKSRLKQYWRTLANN